MYDWWQYRLCDVFIELVKPVMQRNDQDAGATGEKAAFRDTLWTCLDTGLRYARVGCSTTKQRVRGMHASSFLARSYLSMTISHTELVAASGQLRYHNLIKYSMYHPRLPQHVAPEREA